MNKHTNYAVITGASSGIGKALAAECAKAGFRLFLVSRDKAGLEAVARELRKNHKIRCNSLAVDLSDPASPQKVYSAALRYGVPTHLINNAGFAGYGPYVGVDWKKASAMLAVNIVALSHLTRLFLPGMVAAKNGYILNLGSTAAFVPGPLMSAYYASKHYVLAFSVGLAEELRGSGVSVTALCPGPTATRFEATAGMQKSKLFKGKLPTPEQVAKFGFTAMQHKKLIAVHGWRNRVFTTLSKLAPRKAQARYIARAQSLLHP